MTWHRLQKTASRQRRSMRLALLTSKLTRRTAADCAEARVRATWGRRHWHLKSPASLHAKARRPQARVLRSGGRARGGTGPGQGSTGRGRTAVRAPVVPAPAVARWSDRPPASSLSSPAPTSVKSTLNFEGAHFAARPEEPLEAPPERQGTTVAPCHLACAEAREP